MPIITRLVEGFRLVLLIFVFVLVSALMALRAVVHFGRAIGLLPAKAPTIVA